MLEKRYLHNPIIEDLQEKMVFIGGPRQVGKTTLSQEIIATTFKHSAYYNWDNLQDRSVILNSEWPSDAELIILDEIHKSRQWKSRIKGEYDKHKHDYKFLITGSARLDLYRKGSDSLQGRYHYYRLHPFSIAELLHYKNKFIPFSAFSFHQNNPIDLLAPLIKFGGFPEPFLKQNDRHLRRWQQDRIDRLFREDIRDMEQIRELNHMQLLIEYLPKTIASPFSINTIREDLDVSHKTAGHWIDILESFYYHYRIYPFASKTFRSLKKMPKLYLWDWSQTETEGARFENLIASHLLKFVHFLHDYEGFKAELWYLKDTEKREVDFLVTVDKKPWFACEVKLTDQNISPSTFYFKEKLNIPYVFQVIKTDQVDFTKNGVRVISASKFLGGLI